MILVPRAQPRDVEKLFRAAIAKKFLSIKSCQLYQDEITTPHPAPQLTTPQLPAVPMATNGSRSAYGLTRHAVRHCQSAPRIVSASPAQRCIARSYATATESKIEEFSRRTVESERPDELRHRPRWSYTPEAMKAPFSPHITKDPRRSIWQVNNDPKKLDEMYVRFLGRDGDRLLPEEVKWLAVTHKSFDQGRRGFNDRLAYLGRQAVVVETTRSIVSSEKEGAMVPDSYGRKPFYHPALAKIDNFNVQLPNQAVTKEKIEQLALDAGIDKVLRWKPAKPENLAGSGQQIVLNGAVFAIVGAISLQHGAEVAGRVIRERILKPLSLRQ
ncbi:RNase III domain-containing protein [Colletotrichum karsti]|uniref:RNase III domain-containing protein n=1 Tax=Colletotrichum karsti TaxID=1095194 RepID=A0A9P6LLF8_9PEZI|nr:RNase III domain-containing protein [Colletotrichum karsti]KAF9877185.1 RNase III domain-containing protein [Colletotrichum karsti]